MADSSPAPSIHDAWVTPLTAVDSGRLAVVAFEDHWLRRFGKVEVVRLAPGDVLRVLRATADEIWALLEGSAEFHLEDNRPLSPTFGVRQVVRMGTATRLLVPFGVRMELRASATASLLRIMSHSEREDPPMSESV